MALHPLHQQLLIASFMGKVGDNYTSNQKACLSRFLLSPLTVDLSLSSRLWVQVFENDPEFSVFHQAMQHTDFDDFKSHFYSNEEHFSQGLNSQLFLDGLRYLIIPSPKWECFLMNVRKCALFELVDSESESSWMTDNLIAAIAEQCFLNEYVYSVSDYESEALEKILDSLFCDSRCILPKIGIIGCYFRLSIYKTLTATLLEYERKGTLPDAYMSLIKKQILEPEQELRDSFGIASFGNPIDPVSSRVRIHYERNPYPRWVSIGNPCMDTVRASLPFAKTEGLQILIAGCGTGAHAIRVSMMHPSATVTAIDLSLPSIAYAGRKAHEYGVKNLNLVQGDILDVSMTGRIFDVIESVGVIHHMERPIDGLMALIQVLKKGGYLHLGLYSRLARKPIVDLRNRIGCSLDQFSDDCLRRLRLSLFGIGEDHPFRPFLEFDDFYTLSMARDLLCNQQEEYFDFGRIKDLLSVTNMEFISFSDLSVQLKRKYQAIYPDDTMMTDFSNWTEFEEKHQYIFSGMYKFWCKK